ncbi:nitroreductase family protein [Loigolactobacillus jiayinensis]|uniref:Nitroreductase family protein n=1 Tax=Loigolactobacillus jiayinensis TaxID=2486016 RepID=A0ABW1RGD0_9LACO|nr:nitroreductase family protein [Loigolactobacillus jiayinensis]
MQTFDAIIKRKGIRSFNAKQISNEQEKKLIHAANAAPISGGGFRDSARQITFVQKPELLQQISKLAGDDGDPLYGAPTLIILSAPENSFHAEQIDIGLMAQSILLAATDLGLDTILITGIIAGLKADAKLLAALNLPQDYQPFVGIVIGYTDDTTVKTRAYRDDNVNYIR